MAPRCSALNVSDQLRCEEGATSLNGLFCSFHSRQCQALYKGYKRRNAQLDELDKVEPQYMTESTIPLGNQTFADVGTEGVLHEIYYHIYPRSRPCWIASFVPGNCIKAGFSLWKLTAAISII